MNQDPAAYCLEQVRRFDHDRYLAALFAPEAERARLMALYAFNSEIARVREIVSEPVIGQMRLQWWRDALAEMREGKVRAHPVAQALALALHERPVRPELFERMLVAREFDLEDAPPASVAALERYAEGTSSTVLLAALDLLAVHDDALEQAARELGIAWALVGLVRALPFHARQRRVYLPRDLMQAAELTPEMIVEGQAIARLPQIISVIGHQANLHLAAATLSSKRGSRSARPVFLLRVLAERQLARLGRVHFDPYQLPARAKFGDIMRMFWRAWRNGA